MRPVDHYPALLLTALREVAPTGGEDEPTVVVWTPGPCNSAYFEHAFLARQMGVELVEASDLVVRDARLLHPHHQRARSASTRSTGGSTTTSSTRSSSAPTRCSACPGLMRAYRAGTVAIVNAVGTGVADDKAIYHYVPEMIRYYLGEEPILDNVRDLPARRPRAARRRARRGSTELVVKPTSESGGKGVFIGPTATDEELERQAAADQRRAGALDRPGARAALDLPDRDGRTARSRRATSTCARSRSSATTSTSSPAGSRASRCARAR